MQLQPAVAVLEAVVEYEQGDLRPGVGLDCRLVGQRIELGSLQNYWGSLVRIHQVVAGAVLAVAAAAAAAAVRAEADAAVVFAASLRVVEISEGCWPLVVCQHNQSSKSTLHGL